MRMLHCYRDSGSYWIKLMNNKNAVLAVHIKTDKTNKKRTRVVLAARVVCEVLGIEYLQLGKPK